MRWWTFLALSACFAPRPPTGAPCVEDRDCPAPQVCHDVTLTCESSCAGCTTDGSPGDAPDLDGPPGANCWGAWLSGNVGFSNLTRHQELQDANAQNNNPSLANNGLAIYFDQNQDFYRATRQSLMEPFGMPVLVGELRTTENESKISTTADDQVAVFASARPGTVGLLDLWQARRTGQTGTFGPPSSLLFPMINDAGNQFDPEITPDGLHLYYSPAGNGAQTIRHASRADVDDPFSGITDVLPDDNGLAFDPTISPDQRVLVFARRDGIAPPDLFFTTRSSANASFAVATPLEDLNTIASEGDPDLSPDGCTLFFASNRESGGNAIYSVRVGP